jgi:hypothetical protein
MGKVLGDERLRVGCKRSCLVGLWLGNTAGSGDCWRRCKLHLVAGCFQRASIGVSVSQSRHGSPGDGGEWGMRERLKAYRHRRGGVEVRATVL